jgi:hypothetical protein
VFHKSLVPVDILEGQEDDSEKLIPTGDYSKADSRKQESALKAGVRGIYTGRQDKDIAIYDFDDSLPNCVPLYPAQSTINHLTYARYPCPLCANCTVFIPLKDYETIDRKGCLYKFSSSEWLYHWDGVLFPDWEKNRGKAHTLRSHFKLHHREEQFFPAFKGKKRCKSNRCYKVTNKLAMRKTRKERTARINDGTADAMDHLIVKRDKEYQQKADQTKRDNKKAKLSLKE